MEEQNGKTPRPVPVPKPKKPRNTSGLRRGGQGRTKGTPNKVTTEARLAAAAIVDDPEYREKLLAAARARTLPPAVETMLWHYAKGKPKEELDVELTVKTYRWKTDADVAAEDAE